MAWFDKYKYWLLLVAILGFGVFAYFNNRCEQPKPLRVALAQLTCAKDIDAVKFKQKLCQKIYGADDCELQEQDRPVLERMFLDDVNECTNKLLESMNMCTDKVEKL